MKVLLLGSQHGNERLGDALYAHLQTYRKTLLPYVSFVIANPRAHKKNIRFTESDMNRSYNSTLATYEARRATRVQSIINKGDFDVVLDLHTTTCVQPPCCITQSITPQNAPFLRASSINKIVLLRDPIVRTSLIGNNDHAIAIEVNNTDCTPLFLDALASDIDRFVRAQSLPGPRQTYTVDSLLLKSEVSPSDARHLVNFQKTPSGYTPILTGENSYKKNTHYLGLKATKQDSITL